MFWNKAQQNAEDYPENDNFYKENTQSQVQASIKAALQTLLNNDLTNLPADDDEITALLRQLA